MVLTANSQCAPSWTPNNQTPPRTPEHPRQMALKPPWMCNKACVFLFAQQPIGGPAAAQGAAGLWDGIQLWGGARRCSAPQFNGGKKKKKECVAITPRAPPACGRASVRGGHVRVGAAKAWGLGHELGRQSRAPRRGLGAGGGRGGPDGSGERFP